MVRVAGLILLLFFAFSGYAQFKADSTLYADGSLKSKVIYHSSYSERLYYYPEGALNVREEIRSDQIDGVRKVFYKNGQVKSKETYSMGRMQGEASYYYESGVVKRKGEYSDDLYVGVWEMFYDSEQALLKSKGGYVDGKPEGEWQFFGIEKDSIYLSYKGSYVGGKKQGVWFSYYESGALKIRQSYELGVVTGQYSSFDRQSRVLSKGIYLENQPTGNWVVRSFLGFYRMKTF